MAQISFPYPVLLDQGDDTTQDIAGSFAPRVEVTIEQETVIIDIDNAYVTNDSIVELIRNDQALIEMEVESADTYLMECHPIERETKVVRLDAESLNGSVELSFRIVVTEPIEDWEPVGLHSDYGGLKFTLSPGDVIAVGRETYRFHADKDYDPLRAPVASLMSIRRGSHAHGPFQVDLQADKIEVILAKDDHDLYGHVRANLPHLLGPLLAVPVLAEAIRAVRTEGEQYRGCRWYQKLDTLMTIRNITVDRSNLEAAQMLLESPLNRGLGRLADRLTERE